jgi:hypothetical protein
VYHYATPACAYTRRYLIYTRCYTVLHTYAAYTVCCSDVEPVPAAAALEGIAGDSESVFGSYAQLAKGTDNRFKATLNSNSSKRQQQPQQARGFSTSCRSYSSSSSGSDTPVVTYSGECCLLHDCISVL